MTNKVIIFAFMVFGLLKVKAQNADLQTIKTETVMKSYQSNTAWKQINALFPEDFQIKENNLPLEEVWDWKGNKIHLDRYPNPNSEYRVFLSCIMVLVQTADK